ncbi:DUF2894 domain-containing protein [Paraburkholderia dinghuensis]|uniref:DUF2894 domain-containing protein n=2 Tax=Paraburkholderia dinghuensis TaxID=2305225 RepID=A0A3N6MSJ9_9BURK|nr:DUF2894 domain-containing protein [Paraburkholderia dinghuensis]
MDRVGPAHLRFIEALERRSTNHSGKARALLDARLSELNVQRGVRSELRAPAEDTSERKPTRGPLGELADSMSGHARPSPPEMLDYFRKIWASLRTENQLRQSLGQVPQNAGPLNSSSLVHRSLSLMRELSPGYLQHFLSYADSLSWMEHFGGTEAPASKETPRTAGSRKSARSKSR